MPPKMDDVIVITWRGLETRERVVRICDNGVITLPCGVYESFINDSQLRPTGTVGVWNYQDAPCREQDGPDDYAGRLVTP
jgi:hypothetical protein